MGSYKEVKDLMPLQRPRKEAKPSMSIMARPAGYATNGRAISLITNHFHASVRNNSKDYFCHYSVNLQFEDGSPAEVRIFGRQAIDKVKQIYGAEFLDKDFAYDGEHSLFTIGALPQVKNEFIVVIENSSISSCNITGADSTKGSETKRVRLPSLTKTFKVFINYAAKVPMRAILAIEHDQNSEALRILDTILRQQAANRDCLIVQQNYFQDTPRSYIDIGGGLLGCRGFHSSFHSLQTGLYLNMDITTAIIVKPGPVLDFIMSSQNIKEPSRIDWTKARRAMKGLKIKCTTSRIEYKIAGFTELPCDQQMFTLNARDGSGSETEITVYDYYLKYKRIELRKSAKLPCIDVGKTHRPVYLPLELCRLLSFQRYTKALTAFQSSSLVEKSRDKPQERMRALEHAIATNDYSSVPLLIASGVHISDQFTEVKGRILQPPRLQMGNGAQITPEKGRWNIHSKTFMAPVKIQNWVVVNFSCKCDLDSLACNFSRCAKAKGLIVDEPLIVLHEEHTSIRLRAADRVKIMFKQLNDKLPKIRLEFILCILPERRNNNDIYGHFKRACLTEHGIVSQCICPTGAKISEQYLTNVLLKINVKLFGLNTTISTVGIPIVHKTPTIIIGMDVAHGRVGEFNVPSVAAVSSSLSWPTISKFRASTRIQSRKVELIESLFKLRDNRDDGFIRTALKEFYRSCGKKPGHVIVFRDGVGDAQFNQVMDIEFGQLLKACEFLEEGYLPKFTIIVAQKRHNTRFFLPKSGENVPPVTVVDQVICHQRNYDFYITPHAGRIDTSRPIHYHVLHDEIGLSQDELQELVNSLSYINQRTTSAVSVVAPIAYAHLAAAQMSRVLNSDGAPGAASSHHEQAADYPVMPVLHKNICNSMFFC